MTRNAFGVPISAALCADCNAEIQFVPWSDGVTIAQILHDPTCPWLAAMERGGDRS